MSSSVERQFCTFYLDGNFFGINVGSVQEILRFQELTPVPLADPVISGLINLRGQIMTAIDLRARVELPPLPADRKPINVVIRRGEEAITLLVDEIGDVMSPDLDLMEDAPHNTDPRFRSLLRGIYKLEGQLLLILDIEKLMDFAPKVSEPA